MAGGIAPEMTAKVRDKQSGLIRSITQLLPSSNITPRLLSVGCPQPNFWIMLLLPPSSCRWAAADGFARNACIGGVSSHGAPSAASRPLGCERV